MLHTIKILDVNITNERKDKILEYIVSQLKTPHSKTFIITPNPEMLVYAKKHLSYQNKLNKADVALPDGVGLFFASSFMGKQLKERITGVDFIEALCEKCAEFPLSMGFFGGKAGVAERTAECLKKKYPWIRVAYTGSEWNQHDFMSQKEHTTTTKAIQTDTTIDILFVAYGVPKQEEWIYEHLKELPIRAAMGVGGAFDFLSGEVMRAPFFVRALGLEWLFRLIRQPWRGKRQLALLEFILLVFKQKPSHQ